MSGDGTGIDDPTQVRPLDVDALVADPTVGVIVCCGAGGVGKTTTAAALALRAAEAGRSVVVLTIDPARRLAQSLGLEELDNTPRPVVGIDGAAGGRLDAMMLDMKRTFDEVVEAHTTPEKAAQILANPFYLALSSSFAGTQEYMAMEKLGQLRARSDEWDLVVVDTPPSRAALDFLDAPRRLGRFLDGRLVRLLTSPARAGGRASLKVVGAGMAAATAVMGRVLGGDLLRDVQTVVAALDTMFGGFRERAERTYALLQAESTAFLVVATPERDALAEAGVLVDRLRADAMPLAGVVVNRVQPLALPDGGLTDLDLPGDVALAAAGRLRAERPSPTAGLTASLLELHARAMTIAVRHARAVKRFVAVHDDVDLALVPTEATDVHDLEGLRLIGDRLGR